MKVLVLEELLSDVISDRTTLAEEIIQVFLEGAGVPHLLSIAAAVNISAYCFVLDVV